MDCSPPGSCDNCLGDRQSSLTYFFAFDFPLMSWNSGLFLFPSVKLGTWKNLSSNWPRPQGNFARLSVLSWSGPSSMALSLTLLQGRIHFSFLTHISTVFCSFFYHKTFDTDVLSSMHNLFLFPEDLYIVVQSLCHIQLFVTPWTAALQAPLSFTISWSLLKLMSIESVMPSNHVNLCGPLFLLPSAFPASGSFSMSWLFVSGGQSIGTPWRLYFIYLCVLRVLHTTRFITDVQYAWDE